MPHVLYRALNYRNIRLDDDNAGSEEVGVLKKDGTIKYVRWQGFIHRRDARSHYGARPVLLKIKRVDGEDIPEGSYVQGCWISNGVYAVVDSEVAVVATETHES